MMCVGTRLHLGFNTQKEKERNEYFKRNKCGAIPALSSMFNIKYSQNVQLSFCMVFMFKEGTNVGVPVIFDGFSVSQTKQCICITQTVRGYEVVQLVEAMC